MGCGTAIAAVALGATVIEKHFTLARADGGVDSAFSMEPAEMKILTTEAERAWQSLGQISYGATAAEQTSLLYRRSLYVVKDMAVGELFSGENVRAIRPGRGLAPRWMDTVLGMASKQAIKRGTPLSWNLIG